MAIPNQDPKVVTDNYDPAWGIWSKTCQMLKAAGNGNGPWVDIRTLKSFTIQHTGTFGGASVQLKVTNHPDPVNDTNESGFALGAAVTSASMSAVMSGPYRFARVEVTGGTGNAINSILHGVS